MKKTTKTTKTTKASTRTRTGTSTRARTGTSTSTKGKAAKEPARRAGGEATRARILATALDLFRRRGFDRTTMRDVAKGAGVSLGAAYHYFRSKEEIAMAFYREHQQRHAEIARKALSGARTLRERLEAVFTSALDVRGPDRPVFAALTRTVLDAASPVSLFAEGTADIRDANVALMREVTACDEVSETLREPLAFALWGLELGLLLRFVLDDTPGQSATRKLMASVLDLVPPIVTLVGMPMMQPMREQLLRVLAESGLALSTTSGAPTSVAR